MTHPYYARRFYPMPPEGMPGPQGYPAGWAPPPGAYGIPPWYAGQAPLVPMPGQEGVPPGAPGSGGVDLAAAGVQPRPLVEEWRPPEHELTRWGVTTHVDLVTGATKPDGAELVRATLPLPGAVQVLVWWQVLDGAPVTQPEFQVITGIGAVAVPVTPWTVGGAGDGVARVLLGSSAQGGAMPFVDRFPAKWASVNYRVPQPAVADGRLLVGAIVAPITGFF